MWNDFFYYTRSERRIICLLLFLFVLLGGIGTFLFWRNGQAEMPVCHEMAIDSFLQQVQDYEEKRVYRAKRGITNIYYKCYSKTVFSQKYT